ncbi:HNH endonuclease [Nocardia amikacinitolerans]|uniref:HNH endonuclease n=1 Tax=Nocardia amikacinitolerans TaxID=756689 RepID=A0A285LU49_9NOCA|nr:HNH endonuclease [Nocardia amikacinitolerans]SNY88450.1 HNH endonuclease [Nocardia amikacinitolerans]
MLAWAFKSVGDNRDWHSNDGYPDVDGSQYVYSNKVGNSQNVARGDIVVVHDRDRVHGTSRIEDLKIEPDVEVRVMLCPRCHKSGPSRRTTRERVYLCKKCRHEFDDPFITHETRTVYTAIFGTEWRALDEPVSVEALKSVLMVSDRQSSIRRVDPVKLADLLNEVAVDPELSDEAPDDTVPEKSIAGGRRRFMVTVRKNQGMFRRALIRRDGLVCAITGPAPASALHAAHLRAFSKHETHDPDEGLMLRTDLHGLFDTGLLAIDPKTMRVVVSPELAEYPLYWDLRGTKVKSGPWRTALADHFTAATQMWAHS